MAFGLLNYGVLICYLIVLVAIGCRFAGRQKTTEDYFLAGRRMPWLVVGMSMFASLSSAISYMGVPGTAFKDNASLMVLGLCSVAVLLLVAQIMRSQVTVRGRIFDCFAQLL